VKHIPQTHFESLCVYKQIVKNRLSIFATTGTNLFLLKKYEKKSINIKIQTHR